MLKWFPWSQSSTIPRPTEPMEPKPVPEPEPEPESDRRTPLKGDYFHYYLIRNPIDSKKDLSNNPFYRQYQQLSQHASSKQTNNTTKFILDPTQHPDAHLLETIDLVVDVPLRCIENIELDIGGQRIDKLHMAGAYCSFLEDTYGRRIETLPSGKTKIPLLLCGLQGDTYLPFNKFYHHKISIVVKLRDGCELPLSSMSVWATTRTLKSPPSKESTQIPKGLTFISQQTQYTGAEKITQKTGQITQRLSFNHPAYALYFHLGPHHARLSQYIKNVKLVIDGLVYYHGPCEMLPHPPSHSYHAIQFKEGSPELTPGQYHGIWNFSCINYADLILEVEGLPDEEIYLYTFLHSYQILRICNGMYGLAFSK